MTENFHIDFPVSDTKLEHAQNEDLNEAVIRGQALAKQFLRGISRTIPQGDELFKALMAISETGEVCALKGFARALQKSLEVDR
jgi:hypothetical protein